MEREERLGFSDIHIHALYGVDDGAKDAQEMYAILDACYADGIRLLCMTPHCHPGYFGENHEKVEAAFAQAQAYAREKYPELELYLGNELRYERGCTAWLAEGRCRTLNGTDYVLVDFSDNAPEDTICQGLDRLLNGGYIPVLAHGERYRKLDGKLRRLREFRDNGVVIQVDVRALLGAFGLRTQIRARGILSRHLADLVCSDAHDLTQRRPGLSQGYDWIARKCGVDYANAVCRDNARKLILGQRG